jgi:membrane protein DedA with SNARE-associated domain
MAQSGTRFVFLSVLLQQLGVPLPAEPTLAIAGSLSARGLLSLWRIATGALLATLAADLLWFTLGRWRGADSIRFVFRWTASPVHRLRQAEDLFARWGLRAVALAKFVPGFPMLGPLLAGALGAPVRLFLVYDLLAATVWAGCAVAVGFIFRKNVESALLALSRIEGHAVVVAVGVILVIAVWRTLKSRRGRAAAPPVI